MNFNLKNSLSLGEISILNPNELKLLSGNRKININHLNRLKKSISSNNRLDLSPIKINKRLEIIDGQHRVIAAKELGILSVPCLVVDASLEEAQLINQQTKNWNVYDFAYSFAARGNVNYIEFVNFMEQYQLGSHEVMILLGGRADFVNFRTGNFQIKHKESAVRIANMLEDFKEHLPCYRDRSFVISFIRVAKHPKYEHLRMMHKLEMLRIKKCADSTMYTSELERIYNYKIGKANKLKFNDA